MRLSTPLRFAEHLNRAFEAGFRIGQKPITADIVTATLAPDFDDLEPRLTRQGYSAKVLAVPRPPKSGVSSTGNSTRAAPASSPTGCAP